MQVNQHFERFAPPVVLMVILILWQLIVMAFKIPDFLFPAPLQIAKEFIAFKEPLLKAA
jgi:NitT/TauT family transport system permease protein